MTAAQAIARAASLYPNAASQPDRLRWLAQLDCRAALDLRRMTEPTARPTWRILEPADELTIPAPHDEAYLHHIAARAAFAEGDIARYNEQTAALKAIYDDFLETARRSAPAIPCARFVF